MPIYCCQADHLPASCRRWVSGANAADAAASYLGGRLRRLWCEPLEASPSGVAFRAVVQRTKRRQDGDMTTVVRVEKAG